LPALVVPDARIALGELAAGWRAQFDLPVIAVTGSNGKTTVTQMIASHFACPCGDDALSTQGNLNNDIGVPLTLFNLRAHHRIAVVELGMNHPGEIAYLSKLAQPTVALVNNAQREHQEFMGTVEAVAYENGAVLQALPSDTGVAVFPPTKTFTAVWQTLSLARAQRTFAMTRGCQSPARRCACCRGGLAIGCLAIHTQNDLRAQRRFDLHIAGRHNVKNALAATRLCAGRGCAWSMWHKADGL
jgi:UDP-N-acetylmuramoyl-tripeptide--D-alanyl-D-alanine ligase